MASDFIVVGGGLVGAAAAVRLRGAGYTVALVDPGDPRARASYGNATLVANELTEPLASWATARTAPRRLFAFGGPLDFVWKDIDQWLPWSLRYLRACNRASFAAGTEALTGLLDASLPAWRRLLAEIGQPALLDEAPHWAMWESPQTLKAGAAAAHALPKGPTTVRDLASQEVAAVAREASPRLIGGVAFEGSAKLTDPGRAVEALHAALLSKGGEVIEGKVTRLEVGEDAAAAILADGRRLDGGQVLVAAGARSAPLMRQAGFAAPLISERGYHLQYADHDLAPGVPPLVAEDRFICVVRAGDGVRITGFTEVGRPDSPPDPRKWRALRRHVAELALPVRGEPDQWMGARPSLPDFLPAIGRRGRLLYAFGHQHIGLTLAAVTAEAVEELAGAARAPERLLPFRLERFG